jgi:CubicO group peptidase (beta-lactamase class C family)
VAAAGLVLVTACTHPSKHAAPATPTTPRASGGLGTFAWQRVAPAQVGLDAAALDRIAAVARRGKSNCLVVVRRAKLAGAWYFHGSTPTSAQDVFSVTKSITSVLIGIAQDEGKLNIDIPASRWITSWRATPSAGVTVRDLLSNDSGRQWSPLIDYGELIRARNRTSFAVGLGQDAPPGTVWAYNNAAIQTLERVLAKAVGQDVADFARDRLFQPLGMAHTTMGRDLAGNPQTFTGVRSTCEDLARFGLLMLDRGEWGGRRIVSASWVAAATGRPSTPLNAAYGYLWWLNRGGAIATDPLVATSLDGSAGARPQHGRLVPHSAAHIFWALGLGNQVVQVDPGTRTVVVRLGTPQLRPTPPTFGPAEASKVVTRAVVR